MLRVLEERAFPVDELRVYASPRSEGGKREFAGREVTCETLRDGGFDGLDLVIVDVDDPIAAEWAPVAAAAGARVVDNSAAFRMDPDVPLVVTEINPDDLDTMPKATPPGRNGPTAGPRTPMRRRLPAAGASARASRTY